MALSDVKIRNTKPKEKPFKLSDGHGLSLLVNPNGSKWWRFRYTVNGKEKGISFGVYPDVSLLSARGKRTEARRLVAEGIDPSASRKDRKTERVSTFRHVTEEWFKNVSSTWSAGYKAETRRMLSTDLYPVIGDKPIHKITPGDVLGALRQIESRGAFDSAHRTCRLCGQIFRYAIACEMTMSDPSMTLKAVLRKRKVTHYPAITEPKEVAILLRAIDSYHGTFVVKHALRLLPLVFVRPGELRHAEWSEVDFEAAVWAIPAEKI
jgi:integrase